jgi:hypothetical protein
VHIAAIEQGTANAADFFSQFEFGHHRLLEKKRKGFGEEIRCSKVA